ncbi:hypothetical protein DIPPA_13121 [Diplonema papillatum]|nr:hypothetical protein DIPPA_13121 [Diplonema papillatum]
MPASATGGRSTSRRQALKRAIEDVAPDDARSRMRGLYTAASSKRVYRSNTGTYREWCEGEGVQPYPTTVRRLEIFGGYLSSMEGDGYRAPHNVINAIVAENIAGGWVLDDPAGDVRRMIRALKKASPDPESGEPLGAAQFRKVFGFVRTVGEYGAALQLLGEHFTLLRSSSMQSILTDMVQVSKDKVRVEWGMSKSKGTCSRHLTFEKIELAPPLLLPEAPDGAPQAIRYCPVEVFTLLKRMAQGKRLLCPFPIYASFRDALLGNSRTRGILQPLNRGHAPARSRVPFLTHSARIGGCCTLLKAGMDPIQVQKMGDWASGDMVTHYGEKVLRDPDCVEAVRFYNPTSLAHMYTARNQAVSGLLPTVPFPPPAT